MAAASLLTTSYPSASTASQHQPLCPSSRLHHRRRHKALVSVPRLSSAAAAAAHLCGRGRRQQQGTRRGECLLARAGPPGTSTLVFAFVFPLSLIIGTIIASIRIAEQLDERFLEELARNEAIMEEKDAEGGSGDLLGENEQDVAATLEDGLFMSASVEVASVAPQTRNRLEGEA